MRTTIACLVWLAGVAMMLGLIIVNAHAQVVPEPRVGEDMTPELSAWYSSLYNQKGQWCCNPSDTRKTNVRIVGDHFEAWIDERYPGVGEGPNDVKPGWYPVPESAAVVERENIVGEPVVSFYHGVVRCFLDVARG